MGADIHCYIERGHESGDTVYWTEFGGRINPGRDYRMFGVLAGVRGGDPLYEPKGLPVGETGWAVRDDAFLRVNDQFADGDGFCSVAQAECWGGQKGATLERDANGTPTRVSHPDWHSHTWFTTEQYRECLREYARRCKAGGSLEPADARYYAILGAMEAFDDAGELARLVIWFDC